ncbi:selenocysteine-specific elongation factor [Desulfobaculum xiamenense]|uniref:Selenocysteine-specific elongation factor n=1 Tax=Desulfobaculum xiamenense TaxID=995050 RepID=A0A846QSX7_9BACT|nr:selenocysteine-specific translation elongation factor [Desulfobaculum xiamenense]NJB67749.1 selenocysteine-specific elongation factor [Desulfobaculum xiamenense]
MPVIMGTAGHIDHGKTTLVKALTGIDCDRLAEEKKRGITIELGFAHWDMPGGQRLGIIDMPGHERFVKNMVAGASGVDFVVLVIAADEGVMPQTREHLEICTLLGVTRGIVALTKADMVDEQWMELVREDVAGFLEGTFLEDAPLVAVSAHTGAGLEELRTVVADMAASFGERPRTDLFRLPIDRVFTMRGHGTVVTGTLVSGSVKVGDEVEISPRGLMSKVRGLQGHGESEDAASAGRRTAMNLAGLEVDDLERGMVVSRPGTLFPANEWDVELTYLASAGKELKHRKELHLHHGTREVMARIHLFDRDALRPGETALCRLRFDDPMAAVYGDRVVLRSFSPLRTIAGGRIINPIARKARRFTDETMERLALLASGSPEDLVRTQLALAGIEGASFARLMVLTAFDTRTLDKLLQQLMSRGDVFLVDREARLYVSGDVAGALCDGAEAAIAAYHKAEPMKQGIVRGELASSWGRALSERLFHFVVERLVKQGRAVAEAETLRLPQHKVSLAADQSRLRETVLAAYAAGGEAPPNVRDVLEPLGLVFKDAAAVFRLLVEQGELVKIKEDMYFHAPAIHGLRDRVVAFLREKGEMGAPEFKDLTGMSRKFAIPVMEYLDKEKVTMRVGDKRVLRGA